MPQQFPALVLSVPPQPFLIGLIPDMLSSINSFLLTHWWVVMQDISYLSALGYTRWVIIAYTVSDGLHCIRSGVGADLFKYYETYYRSARVQFLRENFNNFEWLAFWRAQKGNTCFRDNDKLNDMIKIDRIFRIIKTITMIRMSKIIWIDRIFKIVNMIKIILMIKMMKINENNWKDWDCFEYWTILAGFIEPKYF